MNYPQNDNVELNTFMEYLKGFKSFLQNIAAFAWRMLKARPLLLLSPLVLALALGVFKYYKTDSLYTVEMQLGYNDLHKKTYGEIIQRLQKLLQHGDKTIVARELNMSETQVEQIADIYALNIARSPLHEDFATDKTPFYIIAVLHDKSIADSLQNRLIEYLRNNPMNQERRRINMANMQDRYNFLEQQLALMDSIKINYNSQLRRGIKGDPLSNQVAIDRLFSLSDSLFQEKLSIRSGLQSYKAIELIYGFMPSGQPDKPSFARFLLKYAGMGLAVSIIFLLWLAVPAKREV